MTWLVLGREPYVATPAHRSAPGAEPAQAATVLQHLEHAVDDGDPAAARALAPSGDPHARTLLGAVVGNARALRVRDFTLRYVDEEGGVADDGSWSAAVDVTWRFAGFDREPAHAETTVRLVTQGDHVALEGFGGGGRRSPLWMTTALQVRRTPSTLVMVAGSPHDADAYARRATTAVPVVRRVLPRWHSGLVVEVPSSGHALDSTLDAAPGEYANIAAVTSTVDGSTGGGAPVHVFVNPDVFDSLRPQGAQVVMSHEAVHVATGAATSSVPLWLLEGFADYVALRDVDLPITTTAGQIIKRVRKDGPPAHLPGSEEFGTTTTHLGATYESAWLACRLLARAGGEAALVHLYERVDHGTPLGVALRSSFGLGVGELTQRWRQDLSGLAS